jgi:AraC-like DNA-binding protein
MSPRKTRVHWSETFPLVRQVALSTAPAGHVLPRAWFTRRILDFDLWLVCDGSADLVERDGKTYPLSRGSVVCLTPGRSYELRVGDSAPHTNLYAHFDLLDSSGSVIPHQEIAMPPPVGFATDMPYFESSLRRMMFLKYRSELGEAGLEQRISHLMKGLLFDCEGARDETSCETGIGGRHAAMVSSALSWLYQHPGTVDGAAELARQFGFSPRHFGRIFRRVTGKTPNRVLIEARIDHAKKLLATSALNVSEIAGSLNYENAFYFSKQFKAVTGMTPTGFRERRST